MERKNKHAILPWFDPKDSVQPYPSLHYQDRINQVQSNYTIYKHTNPKRNQNFPCYIDLIYMRDCPKFPLLALTTEMNNGNHVNSSHVVYLKVKAFVLEPGFRVEVPTKGGIIHSDGEVLARDKGTYKCDQKTLMAYDKLQLKVDQGLATLFCPV